MATQSDIDRSATGGLASLSEPNGAAEPQASSALGPAVQTRHDQGSDRLSREELRSRALLSRNSYRLGELPNESQGAEIDLALKRDSDDELTLGVAFRYLVLEEIPDDERISTLKDHFGHDSSGTAVGLRQHLDATRFGIFPRGISMARQIAARMKSLMNRHEFSAETRAILERNVVALQAIAADAESFEAEQEEAEKAERNVEDRLKGRVGVYVFTYPHYLRYPTHPSDALEKMPDRTLLKVGFTDNGILERVNQETSGTGVPEHRRILRAYLQTGSNGDPCRGLEQQFHDLLDAAGHAGPKRGSTERRRGGNEWFSTSVEFLDCIARTLALEIVEVVPDNEL